MNSTLAFDEQIQTRPSASVRRAPVDVAARWLDTAARFSSTGGLMVGEELMRQMRQRWVANGLVHPTPDPVSTLARWVVAGSVLSIESPWGYLLPAFQFDPATASSHPCMRPLLQLMRPVFEDAELALWFVTPNDWLDDQCPAHAMHGKLSMVLMAARLDRHVASGGVSPSLGATAHRQR